MIIQLGDNLKRFMANHGIDLLKIDLCDDSSVAVKLEKGVPAMVDFAVGGHYLLVEGGGELRITTLTFGIDLGKMGG